MSKNEKKDLNKFSIKPLRDKVVLEDLDKGEETKTSAGIIIPASAGNDHETKKGKVVAVGSGKIVDGKNIPIAVQVGETVLYSWGDNITVEGKKYIIVSEDNITAIIK